MSLAALTSPTNNVLPNMVAALSVLATSVGLVALIDPLETIPSFGLSFPVQNDKKNMDLVVALTRVYGVRNMSMGIVNLALWWNARGGNPAFRKALGLGLIFGLATPIVDGVVCEVQGKTSGWKHWAFVPVSAALGFGLLVQL